jgi:hypothetical protein
MSLHHQAVAYARYAWTLRAFLQEPATAARGRELIRQRLRDRPRLFLNLVKHEVYDNTASAYLPLLQHAGCEYGDLEHMVDTAGVEGALQRLCNAGVYLSHEEFKGRQPVVRGGRSFGVDLSGFLSVDHTRGLQASTSGSRGPATTTMIRLERVAFVSLCYAVVFSAHHFQDRATIVWMPILPSGAGVTHLLQLCKMRVPPERWFSPVAASTVKPALSKRLATMYIVHAGRLFGAPIPSPEYISGEQTAIVAECLRDVLRCKPGCVVACSPSAAVRVCQVARAAGIDLHGVSFAAGGEPLTPAKMSEIQAAGADAFNIYAFTEGGIVGFGCAGERDACDDIHLQMSTLAAIQRERNTPFGGGVVKSFLFTSLLHRPSRMLLNVESGDYGVLETRHCGCELGELGLTQHLHAIRSFDKLTGEGMTFVGTDMVRIVEEVLPRRFGGASTDYQMAETEDGGRARVDVLVSPAVGAVDENEVVNVILAELSRGSDTNRMMAEVWRQGQTLRVIREKPRLTAAGKLLSLHITPSDRKG